MPQINIWKIKNEKEKRCFIKNWAYSKAIRHLVSKLI